MTPLVRRCALPLSLAIGAATLAALPAVAAPTWVPAVEVQNGSAEIESPVVAVDAQGAATMIWLSDSGSGYTVRASTHPLGGTWSAPQDLSAVGADPGEGDEPGLAVDAAGNATAVWSQDVGTPQEVVQTATRPAGGAWSPAIPLSDPAADSYAPSVGVDGSGHAVAVWVTDTNTDSPVVVGATKSAGGGWSATFPLSEPDAGASRPQVAVAPDGRATAVWVYSDPISGSEVVETRSRPSATAPFEGSEIISSTLVDADRPGVAVNAAGAASVVWEEDAPKGNALHGATRTAAGVWSAPDLVSGPADDAAVVEEENGSALVVLDAVGTSTVVWRRRVDDGTDVLRTLDFASATSAGDWSAPAFLANTGSGSGLGLALDPAGNVTAAWQTDGVSQLSVARRDPSGTWSGAVPLEFTDGRVNFPTVAASSNGDVVVGYAFQPDSTALNILYTRAFDVDGPVVQSLSIPGTGTVGQPVSYAVAAPDAWSTTSTVWSFGDGVTASGASVSHTFAAAGTYAVSVTVTDAVGNARTRTGTTVVAAAPVVTPPAATPKPTLTGVKLTKKTIHVKGSDESPKATKLKLKLNTDAKIKVVLKRTNKVDGKAVKATVTKALEKGSSAIKLTSKVGGKKLPPGTYTVKVTAKNSVGTSATKKVKLIIEK